MQMQQSGRPAASQPRQTEQVVDFYHRERGNGEGGSRALQSGEIARLKGSISVSEDGIVFVVPEYDGGGHPRSRSPFELGPLKDNPELASLVGGVAELQIRINPVQDSAPPFGYLGTLVAPPVPQVMNDVSPEAIQYASGRVVSIEGRVVQVNPGNEFEDGSVVVQLSDGQRATLNGSSGSISYSSGVLENLHGKPLVEGDVIRGVVFVHPAGSLSMAADAHLLRPSNSRAREYGELRSSVSAQIGRVESAIDEGDYGVARDEVGTFADMETTRRERQSMYGLFGIMPEAERPILNDALLDSYYARPLGEAYGVDLVAMTKAEFIDFATSVGTFSAPVPEDALPQEILTIAQEAGLSTAQQESLLKHYVDALSPQVRGRDQSEVTYPMRETLDNAIYRLGRIDSASAAAYLLQSLSEEIEAGRHLPSNLPNEDFPKRALIEQLTAALSLSGRTHEGIRELSSHLKEITELHSELRNSNNPKSRQHLQRLIDEISDFLETPEALDTLRLPPVRR